MHLISCITNCSNKTYRLYFGRVALTAVVLFFTHIAFAGVEQYDFEIPSQEVSTALDSFAEITRYSMLYSLQDIGHVFTCSVSGRYTPEKALDIMFQGTGLEYKKTSDSSISIKKRQTDGKTTAKEASNQTAMPATKGKIFLG